MAAKITLEPVRSRLRHTWLRNVMVAVRHWGINEHDVFLDCFPKSGSTWLSFMLAQLLSEEKIEQKIVDQRFLPGIGKQRQARPLLPGGGRLIRTHEPYRPCYGKAIYVVRDGRDVAVSLYWQLKRARGLDLSFEDYVPLFLSGHFHGYGPWHKHIESWLDSPVHAAGHVLIVRYEDLKEDALRELVRVVEFLGVDVPEERYDWALEAGSFDNMRKSEQSTQGLRHREKEGRINVVRKGIVGDWKNYFTDPALDEFQRATGDALRRLGYDLAPAGMAQAEVGP